MRAIPIALGPAGGHASSMPRHRRLRATILIIGMVGGCLSIWTLSPLLWLWIASQVDKGGPPSMSAITVVIVGVALTTIAIGKGLATLQALYREIDGTRPTVKLHLAWLRSLRGERPRERAGEVELTVLDAILVASVLIALGLYQYWFLFKAGSPIDLRTGRG